MPKKAKELSAREVSRLKKPGSHPVGGVAGLLMRISPAGAKSWVLRVSMGTRVNKAGNTVQRRRDIGLGGYPDVTLAMAREKAREKRELIEQGVDPVEQRAAQRRELQAEQAKRITFSDAAVKYHKMREAEFSNKKHYAQWISTLETYAYPVIGQLTVENIETYHIEKILLPIWETKTETGKKVRGRIEAVIRWAYTRKKIDRQNPARWQGNLKELMPDPNKFHKVKHYPSLHYSALPDFMAKLSKKGGIGARALEFAILTASRSGEVRGMTWGELNLDTKLWQVPAERMKARKLHTVPLSKPAIALINTMPEGEKDDLVFTALRGGQLSDMTLSKVLRDMEVDAVPHGMRSTFKVWAQEKTTYPDEASELALAHVNSDATRTAYARSELIDIRREMMDDWADFCNAKEGKVVSIHKKVSRKKGK
jgi:integrase